MRRFDEASRLHAEISRIMADNSAVQNVTNNKFIVFRTANPHIRRIMNFTRIACEKSRQPLIQGIAKRATLVLALCVIGALTTPLSAALVDADGTLPWLIDLAANWQWLYLALAIVCSAALLVTGGRPLHIVPAAGAVLIVFCWPLANEHATSGSPAGEKTLTVISANLNIDNTDVAALKAWASKQNADIVVVQEVTPETAALLAEWVEYPHRRITASFDPFGLAILSRHPITDIESLDDGNQPLHYRALLDWNGRSLAVAAIHPMPPISAEYHQQRARLLEQEARWLAHTGLPSLLVGDLNSTPWSSAMRHAHTNGLGRATSTEPSWPARLPLLPLDHVLANDSWTRVASGRGPDIGSDHRPVFATLAP